MHFYIDDPSKFEEDCFYLSEEDKAVIFELNTGELIRTGGIVHWTTGQSQPIEFKPTERYKTILPGIECEHDYVD